MESRPLGMPLVALFYLAPSCVDARHSSDIVVFGFAAVLR
jgi:hypothetical protein